MGKTELKLEIDSSLLDQARAAGVPLETALEAGVKLALKETMRPLGLDEAARRQAADPKGAEQKAKAWERDNAEAIASHNRFVEAYGAFGEDLRSW